MKYAVATWDLHDENVPLAREVAWYADHGFDAVSFDPASQRDLLTTPEGAAVKRVVEERDLAVTVHSHAPLDPADAGRYLDLFGARLLNITMNPVAWHDSRGILIDAKRLCGIMREIERVTRGTGVCFGTEDVPRDRMALEFYKNDLEPLLGHPRYGVIIDLGHMNLWLHTQEYYRGVTCADYLSGVPVPILEVHVHDNHGDKDSHSPLGAGNLDIKAAAGALRRIGFDRVSTIEIDPSNHGKTAAEFKLKAVENIAAWKAALA
jgi:sugar phosphate isomerase/epimerase